LKEPSALRFVAGFFCQTMNSSPRTQDSQYHPLLIAIFGFTTQDIRS